MNFIMVIIRAGTNFTKGFLGWNFLTWYQQQNIGEAFTQIYPRYFGRSGRYRLAKIYDRLNFDAKFMPFLLL